MSDAFATILAKVHAGDTGASPATLVLTAITADKRCQPRETMSLDLIDEYAEAMSEGAIFPPVTIYRDGTRNWLADGFHRLEAAKKAGLEGIGADIKVGGLRDAILHAAGANAAHGMRRTNADKRKAVTTLLEDAEWAKWSNNEIAKKCAVSHTLVNHLRCSLETDECEIPTERTYITKHGTVATMNTSNIGRQEAVKAVNVRYVDKEPEAVIPQAGPDVDDEDEKFPPSTPEQCQAVVTALEGLLLARQRPDGERVTLTEAIEHLAAHADPDTQKWVLTELVELRTEIAMDFDLDPLRRATDAHR